MRRWNISFCLAFAGLILGTIILPFHDFFIELQPDGTNLGRVSAWAVRFVAFLLGSLPLLSLSVIAKLSQRVRLSVAPWTAVAPTFVLSFLLVVFVFLNFRSTHF
jgi:hypothetical protein